MKSFGWEDALNGFLKKDKDFKKLLKPSTGIQEALEQLKEREGKALEAARPVLKINQPIVFNKPILKPLSMPSWEVPSDSYSWIEEIVSDNSKYGWTLTGEMNLYEYLDASLQEMSHEEKDAYFLEYYKRNDWEALAATEAEILKSINVKWQPLLKDTFEAFRNGKIRLVIPTLFSVIDGRLSELIPEERKIARMMKALKEKADQAELDFHRISLYSILISVGDELFATKLFDEPRYDLINRHWVLHGRDNPNLWTETDALRLFTVISTLEFIEDIIAADNER